MQRLTQYEVNIIFGEIKGSDGYLKYQKCTEDFGRATLTRH